MSDEGANESRKELVSFRVTENLDEVRSSEVREETGEGEVFGVGDS